MYRSGFELPSLVLEVGNDGACVDQPVIYLKAVDDFVRN
jgi:hypothetical protein